ncbi:hypothetical protein M569_08380, partial [Genlisea aurea]
VTCSSFSTRDSGIVDYESRPSRSWSAICKRISESGSEERGVFTVLNQAEKDGRYLTRWELCRIAKELRKFRRYKFALEVFDWMNNRPERFRITTSDTAIRLDLIAKVHGIPSAESYFSRLTDELKDKRIYGSLLNVYARAKMREEAETLMDKMRTRGYATQPLPYNVMMTLYLNLKDHEKVECLVAEMRERSIELDIYSYNIWLSSRGSLGSVERMEQVFDLIQLDPSLNPNWATFSSMAATYIRLGYLDKACDCLKKIEIILTSRDRLPYHHLISLYGSAGKSDEVRRMWNLYKATFPIIPNVAYNTVISALLRTDEIDDARKLYDEWAKAKTRYDPRIGNLFLVWYSRNGLGEKVESFFDEMSRLGCEPNGLTWEVMAEYHIRNGRPREAVSCVGEAVAVERRPKKWAPKPSTVAAILRLCEEGGDAASREGLVEILRSVGRLGD